MNLLVLLLFLAQQGATLDRVEKLLNSGQLEQARTVLAQWKKEHKSEVKSEQATRAAYLGARLTMNAQEAEDGYLAVAISGSRSSPYVPESLLRVGQAELLNSNAQNAKVYLKRVLDDYPTSEHAATASEWLTRADSVKPRPAILDKVPDVPTSIKSGKYAVQLAAFREMTGAQLVIRSLKKAGYSDVRIVTVPDNDLLRVRVGSFTTSKEAADLAKKLRAEGHSAVVVDDATRERVAQ